MATASLPCISQSTQFCYLSDNGACGLRNSLFRSCPSHNCEPWHIAEFLGLLHPPNLFPHVPLTAWRDPSTMRWSIGPWPRPWAPCPAASPSLGWPRGLYTRKKMEALVKQFMSPVRFLSLILSLFVWSSERSDSLCFKFG